MLYVILVLLSADSSCFPEFVELFGRAGGFVASSPDFAIQLDRRAEVGKIFDTL